MLTHSDETQREIDALHERIAQLNSAILRVSASLDLETVLHEIVESARALTRVRYGAIITIDRSGQPQDLVFSGLTLEEHQKLEDWQEGPQIFEHFRDISGILTHENLHSYVRSLGYSAELLPPIAFTKTPMHHLGVQVGSFFLAGKVNGESFTGEDEKILMLFASQAATAIANARTYRDEQKARANLEALVETSPVGVVVFDAKTGHPASLNREAKRIVESLRTPGSTSEQLLEVMSCRFADGREFPHDNFPLTRMLSTATTMRAEEVELSVPDGRSVHTLINVTPIPSADSEVESVVITIQDLAPFEELEQLRAEFLSMVSHELHMPLTSIKGSTASVLDTQPVPDPAQLLQFFRIIDDQANHMRGVISDLLDVGRIDTGMLSVLPVPSEVASLVDQARSTFLSGGGRHAILIDLPQNLPPLMADRQRIIQVLNNLLSNASKHSPESTPIYISAAYEDLHVAVSVTDEGRGVSAEQLPRLFQKYTNIGHDGRNRGLRGSGLGLAICKGLVEAHGGRIHATSGGVGQGMQITFTLPVVEEAGNLSRVDATRDPSRAPHDQYTPVPILVVDDDPQMLLYLRDTLATKGYAPVVTSNHRELSRIFQEEKPQLVLLDLVLPETDGIELMKTVPELSDVPVIFISSYGRDETIARALEHGAADYIVKPFSPTELIARVKAALRKRNEPQPFLLGDLAIYYEQHKVTLAGHPVQLTLTEYEVLRLLSTNAGRITTFDSLLHKVWHKKPSRDPRLVRTIVKNLRRKLGDDSNQPTYIFSERGAGYRMADPSAVRHARPGNGKL